jgi:hypothetical protein
MLWLQLEPIKPGMVKKLISDGADILGEPLRPHPGKCA